ncbi:hypothetical protein hamaS1_26190 [Moorella sp. Hama-1]|nr:hypothetical protein hamaS1_26190 [Moorella sp. Hama-1]
MGKPFSSYVYIEIYGIMTASARMVAKNNVISSSPIIAPGYCKPIKKISEQTCPGIDKLKAGPVVDREKRQKGGKESSGAARRILSAATWTWKLENRAASGGDIHRPGFRPKSNWWNKC